MFHFRLMQRWFEDAKSLHHYVLIDRRLSLDTHLDPISVLLFCLTTLKSCVMNIALTHATSLGLYNLSGTHLDFLFLILLCRSHAKFISSTCVTHIASVDLSVLFSTHID